MNSPNLSVVLLTRNEEANVAAAVRSLLAQEPTIEVIVVDSASTDRTLDELKALEQEAGARLRVVASPRDIAIGEARNLGVALARAPAVAFMSADATAAPGWARAALTALASADIVYGKLEHDPPSLNVAAVVRGLRYHHYRSGAPLPAEAYASNVDAAIRREVFERVRYVDDPPASALDDVLFTREARSLGFRVAYAPDMVVRHKDVSDFSGELRKARREGYGWGLLAPKIGLHRTVLAWGAATGLGLVLSLFLPPVAAWFAVLVPLYAPALRRAAFALRRYARAPHLLLAATLASPVFDVAFLLHYVRGLRNRRRDLTGLVEPQGT